MTDISVAVEAGTCCAILGPNGSGKSALVAVISGYLWPSGGTAIVNGQVYGRVSLSRVRRAIGLIEPSRVPAFDERMCVREVVATGLLGTLMLPPGLEVGREQWRRVEEELSMVGLEDFGPRPYAVLSTGEQMKTLLARAMVSNARILLLDEPTVGLDMGARMACMEVLDGLLSRPDSPTVVIVSHHLDELPRVVAKVLFMNEGRVVGQGPPDALLTSVKLSELFRCRVEVFRRNGRLVASVCSSTGDKGQLEWSG